MAIKTPKKFTPQEIEQVKKLQSEVNQITMQLGLLQISKLKLEEQEVSIKNQLLTLEKEETKLKNNFYKYFLYLLVIKIKINRLF